MNEEILYEMGPVKITPVRVMTRGATYVVANITSVRVWTDTAARIYGGVVALLGLGIMSIGTVPAIALGLALIGFGVLIAIYGTYTQVVLTTGASEQKAFRSRDEKAALEVASAINLAIMKRSVLMGR